jgi:hypothetical protein
VCVGKEGARCSTNQECSFPRCDTFYEDKDGDGYGNTSKPQGFCSSSQSNAPAGFAKLPGDCCEADPDANPGYNVGVDKENRFSATLNLCGSWDFNCDGVEQIACPGEQGATCARTGVDCRMTSSMFAGDVPCGQQGAKETCCATQCPEKWYYEGFQPQTCR